MTDDADRADLYIQQMLDSALNRINTKQSQEFGECMDCGEEIPEKRRKAVSGVKYCINCQQFYEKKFS